MEMLHISKHFGDSDGIADFSLRLEKGSIHGVLGGRRTGKTTLARILGGLARPDSGSIRVEGQDTILRNPRAAAAWGIGYAGEENPYVQGLSLGDHLRLGSEYAPSGKLGKRAVQKQAVALCDQFGIPLDIERQADEMTRADWLWAEILRMVMQEKDILVLDEPDGIFTQQEMDKLISVLQSISNAGNAVLLFSRKPETVLNACEQITVLFPDAPAETYLSSEETPEELALLIYGEKAQQHEEKKEITLGGIALEVRRLTVWEAETATAAAHDLSFEVRSGEILCLLGRPEHGWDALASALIGVHDAASGRIKLEGKDISRASVRERLNAGMVYLPQNIRKTDVAADLTLEENLTMHRYRVLQESGWIRRRKRKNEAEQILGESGATDEISLDCFPDDVDDGTLRLLLLSRAMNRKPALLIAEEPERHVSDDMAALIRERLLSARANRQAVLLLTSQPEEAMRLADRILVLFEGEIMGEFDPVNTSVRELGWYMSGQWRQQRYGGRAIEGEDE